MANTLKKINTFRQPLWMYFLNPKRATFLIIAAIIFTGFALVKSETKVSAATGINSTINFQGKVVNSNGTNVADGQYTFVFKIYDAPSGGSNPWTETQNNVQVTGGVFRVSLGSVTPITGVDFNTDNIYLGINFNSDGEMTPRVRFASVPYAFNAQSVAGLTVTNTTGTLTIPNSKTVSFGGAFTTSAQDLTLTLSGGTNVTLPTTGTLATLAGVENLSNKTFTTTITVNGVTTDISTGTNEDFSIIPNGTGKVNINATSGAGSFNIRPNGVTGGTLSIASVLGSTSFAALLVDNNGSGDIFAASASGTTKFVLKNDGTASTSAGLTIDGVGNIQSTNNQLLTIGGVYTGDLRLAPRNGSGIINLAASSTNGIKINGTFGAGLTAGNSCVSDIVNGLVTGTTACSVQSIPNFWQYSATNGIIANGNLTTDLLVGATSTQAASFMVLGVAASTNPSASVSAQNGANATKGLYMSGDGSLQSVRKNTLTVGGNTTGDIQFKPGNATNPVLYLASNGAIGVNGSFGSTQNCLVSNGAGAGATWGNCLTGPAGMWFINNTQGTNYSVNTTLDTLFGGNSTASAGFRIAGATKNYGTVAAASVSANTSFAGFVIDNRGTGDLLTASSSGLTRFTVFQSGNVTIGSNGDQGYKLDVQGSVRIGNNTTTDDIVKQTTADFTVSGSSISTNDSVNTVSTTGDQLKLVTDLIGAGASLTAPAAHQTTGANVTTGSVAFQRPDRKFVVFVGGAATSKIYDPTLASWTNGPSSAGPVSLGAGARAFQRQNGSFLVIHGGAASSTTVYSPGGSTNLGTVVVGPTTTAAVGAGSQIIRRSDGKVLVIHGNTSSTSSVHDPVTATGTTSVLGSFITGPATTGNVVAGSFVFQRPDGSWILGLGGGTTTNVYNPSTPGVGGGGAFVAGPSLTTGSPAAGTHVIQLPDGRYMVLVGGSTATQIYDIKSNTFSAGSTMTATIGAGSHSFQRSDGKWVVVAGGNTATLMLFDPTSGANGSFSTLGSGLSASAGAGALTLQRPDGKYVVVHGNTVQTTTLYDAGWNTTGTWTSEDILNTKISTYSAMLWSANPQSANNNARLDPETINFAVKTGDTTTSLANNAYRALEDSGDLIRSYGNAQYAKIQITFTVPVRSYATNATSYIQQSNIWEGEGGTFIRRSFIQPTVFSIRIQNPLVSYGDPSGQGDPAFGRNFATGSAQLEGVVTDNSNRLSLSTLRNLPTSTASAGFIIASASANLGGNAGAGAHTIERNNGQFVTILGNSTTTTRTYDVDTNTWSLGPDLPNAAGAGAHSFLLPDGRFFVVLGNTTNRTAIFDPQTNQFQSGPLLYGNVGSGANTFQRTDGFFVILNGGATSATNILDPYTMAVTQGPFTTGTTPNVGAGALNIRRSDGRILVILGNANAIATATNVYDPATNAFAQGPALVGGTVSTGGNAIETQSGRILLFKSTATSNNLDPIQNTFAAGPTPLANGAGSFLIPRSDGKILKATGATTTTSVIDPQAGTAVTGTSAPTLPCTVNTGSHVFQRHTGEYVVICGGGTANTTIIDAGWNLGGTYTTEQMQVPNLSGTSSIFWKNTGKGNITVKYRTAASQQLLGVASWKDLSASGSYLTPNSGDSWLQVRFDLQGALQDLPGAKTRVWNGSDSGGGMVYYRSVQAPILQYWKLMNIQDPTVLTLTSGGNNIFRFASDGQAYTSDGGAWNSGGADLAERYTSQDTLEAGEVVSLDRFHAQNTKRSTIAYDQNVMGVVSTQPGFVAGAYTENSYPIALVGRVPVKVSTENGQIKAGDYLTAASIPGYAMKATVAGRVLGQAMEDFDTASAVDCPKFNAGNLSTTQCGTITVFVNLTSYDGQSVAVAMKDNGYALKENELPLIAGVDFSEGTDAKRQQDILGFLKSQKDNGQEVYTDRVAATQEIISPTIVTDLLIAKKIKAESIEGFEILTNNIEQLSNRVATGSALLNFTDRLTLLTQNQEDFQIQMASLSAKLDRMGAINILDMASRATGSSELTMVNNLGVYGTTTLSEASVLNTVTIGSGTTMNITANSIDTIGEDLSIQSLRQGAISFLGGLIRFDTDGKARFGEDVAFEKNVAVSGVLSARTIATTDLQLGQGETTVISDTEVEATGAAGLVTLKKDNDRVKVTNPLVKDSSFIFITPKTRINQSIFLIDQVEGKEDRKGSFTVGVDGHALDDIKFNYLIVN